jgi:ATP-dependent protease HslVU (ClpYQ) peptidase subunit
MAINGVIYIIDSDYSWISDTSGLFAIGSGSQFALGAMHAIMPKGKITLPTARKVALKAIATAARFDPYTGAPYQTIVQEVDKPIGPQTKK